MIQRPQTLILLTSAILVIISFFTPLWVTVSDPVFKLKAYQLIKVSSQGKEVISNFYHIAALGVIAVAAILFTVFKYDNRLLQMKLTSVCNLLVAGYVVLIVAFAIPQAQEVLPQEISAKHHWSFYLPLVAVILNIIAKYLIKRDEKLVRSVDRLR